MKLFKRLRKRSCKRNKNAHKESHRWTQISFVERTMNRSSFTFVPHGTDIFLFGGVSDRETNDFYIFNTLSHTWKKINKSPHFPSLSNHSAVVYQDSIIIFGGTWCDDYYNDVWEFQIRKKYIYKCMISGTAQPEKRAGHGSVCHGDAMYIFGGHNNNIPIILNDVWKFDLTTNSWHFIDCDISPNPMYLVSAAVVKDNMYVFGNHISDKYALWQFNFISQKWKNVITNGNIPSSQANQRIFAFENSLLLLDSSKSNFELYSLDLETMTWQFNSESEIPKRSFYGCAIVNDVIFLYGGSNGEILFGDMWFFTLKKHKVFNVYDSIKDCNFIDIKFKFL